MGEALVITSGKGGVGKSTLAANLAMALSDGGQKVVLIDSDTGLRNLDVLLGMENRVVYDLTDVVFLVERVFYIYRGAVERIKSPHG